MKKLDFCSASIIVTAYIEYLDFLFNVYLERLYYCYFFTQIIPAFNITTFSKLFLYFFV